ncbi:MAG: PAS domain S-box protein [Deltaproteobacteria bacterium]|nr:PAS domain S-box protein [Deltaproteobacteria bacterium]
MEEKNFSQEKRVLKISKSLSVWLTTVAVIVLILLLALTINRAREKEMVQQFGQLQQAIAEGTAARIEDLIDNVGRSLVMLSSMPGLEAVDSGASGQCMKNTYDYLNGGVDFIAWLDGDGKLMNGYPDVVVRDLIGKRIVDAEFIDRVNRQHQPWIYDTILENKKIDRVQAGKGTRFVILGVPAPEMKGRSQFLNVAAVSIPEIAKRYVEPAKGIESSSLLMVEKGGTILLHSNNAFLGADVDVLEDPERDREEASLRRALREGRKGYGEYLLKREGGATERHIVAYAPIRVGQSTWSIAIATPYRTVISQVRKTFIHIMVGAIALIMAVIVAGLSIAHTGQRRLRLEEELKRLRERNEWQEKLIREKRTVEGVIEGTPIPTFVIDRNHRIIFWNKACTDLTGYEGREMIGTDGQYLPFYPEKRPVLADLIIDRDSEGLQRYYGKKRVQKSSIIEGAYEAAAYFENLNGRGRHLYFLAAPMFDEKGEIIAAIETLQDVSREEEMDQNLREYAETLRKELIENINLRKEVESLYSYLQSILDSSPDQLFDLNADGTVNFMSRDLQRGRGLVSQQIKGKHILEFIAPEHRPYVMEKWNNVLKGIYAPFEVEATAKDGTKRNLLVTPRPIQDTDRYILVQRDITEFKTLEDKYYESQKLAAIGQLSAGIAHEIRNPLSSIKMSLQILEKRMQPEANDLKRFKIAQREVEHLEQLVNDVLIYAKPAEPKCETSDLRRILEHVLAMTEMKLLDKYIEVQTRFDDRMPLLTVDAAMLEQAFLNLCLNAIEAMEPGGRLSISTVYHNNETKQALVEIEDNGCGIDEADMPHIFNPFFTTKKYGTGLGMTPVKKIVELHQGAIDIVSKKGEGTRVVVILPAEAENEGDREIPGLGS